MYSPDGNAKSATHKAATGGLCGTGENKVRYLKELCDDVKSDP